MYLFIYLSLFLLSIYMIRNMYERWLLFVSILHSFEMRYLLAVFCLPELALRGRV